MRLLNRALGVIVAVVGVVLVMWAPPAFEILTGGPLPMPVATDQAAMTVWSGVALLRVFGAVLFGVGAVLWAGTGRAASLRGIHVALLVSSVFAGLIVAIQQAAIWTSLAGWALAGLFGAVAIGNGLLLFSQQSPRTTGSAV